MKRLLVTLSLLCYLPVAFSQDRMLNYELDFQSFDPVPERIVTQELKSLTPFTYYQHPEFGVLPHNAQCDECTELLHKRTLDSRFFIKNGTGGEVFYVQKAYGPIHYENIEGQLVTIDHRLSPSGNDIFTADQQAAPVKIDLNDGFSSLTSVEGLEFKFNHNTRMYFQTSSGQTKSNPLDYKNYSAGKDGIINYNSWPDIDRRQEVNRSEIKTSFIINSQIDYPSAGGWMVIEEDWEIPEGYDLVKRRGYETEEGFWNGDLVIQKEGTRLITIHRPIVLDNNEGSEMPSFTTIAYDLDKDGTKHTVRIMVNLEYLTSPERVYPIIIDPLVSDSSRYTVGEMAFKFDPTCFNLSNYCGYPLQVVVPGMSELINAVFDAEYWSRLPGMCGINQLQCKKFEAAFRIAGPCSVSPTPNGWWTCDSSTILGQIPGLCYGRDIPMYNTINCIPPQCPDYVLDFEMRTYHCACNLVSGCDTSCYVMRTGTWSITIEAKTLEGFTVGSNTICLGDSTSITAFADWGVPPYSFSWSPGGATDSSIMVAPVNTTTYTCVITDTCGVTVTDQETITVNPLPTITSSSTPAFCSGGSDGTATATGSGTPGPYNYSWSTNPVQNTQTANGLSPGQYMVTVTDGNGCSNIDSVIVGFVNQLDITDVVTNVTCNGFSDGAIDITVISNNSPFSYSWSHGPTTEDIVNIPAGSYTLTVTDAIGCVSTYTTTVIEPAVLTVDAGPDQTILLGQSTNMVPIVFPPGTYTYSWVPASGLNNSTILNPVASPDSTTTYYLTATSTLNPNCTANDSVTINVLPPSNIYIPNAFSPNGDAINDVFFEFPDIEIVKLQIFNRWGGSNL